MLVSDVPSSNAPGGADVRFFEEVGVVDSDEPTKIYAFSVLEPEHGACFNIGMGPDGTALISYSDLFGFYQLPDGTKWAEHGYLYDREDVVSIESTTILTRIGRVESVAADQCRTPLV